MKRGVKIVLVLGVIVACGAVVGWIATHPEEFGRGVRDVVDTSKGGQAGTSPNVADSDTIPASAKIEPAARTEPESESKPQTTTATDPVYHESNEAIDLYALSKNPYKYKGQSGVFDTANVPVIDALGRTAAKVPLGSLRFDKMLDEHTALFDTIVHREGSLEPDGQIAVVVPGSDPPETGKPWKILVVGALQGVNAFGTRTVVAAVRFEGYYTPKPTDQTAHSEQAPQQ